MHNQHYFNSNCKPYSEVFSREQNARSLSTYAFPVQERGAAEKCHEASVWLQKGARCPVIHHGERSDIIANRKSLSRDQVTFYSTPEGIVDLNKDGIELALERRVALFFQQAILCYKMSLFTFSASGADDQIGSSPKEVFSTADGGGRVSHKREAAHSSTLPALIAHAKDGSTPNGFVYLKGGSSHSQHNATIGMNECVNGADELIDGKGTNENLRNTTLKIINRVADGLDPVSATKEFIQSFKARVSALTANDNRSFVLREYKKGIEIIQEASKDETLYDRMLGVVIDSNDSNATKLREIVYQRRYDIIRLQEVIESRIGKRIQNMKDAMNKTDRSFVNYILLKKFSDANERQTLEKLFGMTAVIFEQEYEELLKQDGTPLFDGKEKKSLRSFKTKVSNISEKYRAAITGFQKDLENDFNELRCAEWSYRAKVFKDIRVEVKNWTQPEFCDHYLAKVGHRISKTWVSRMENLSRLGSKAPEDYKTPVSQRRKYLSLQDVKNCAKAFGVDAGLFLPSLFTGV